MPIRPYLDGHHFDAETIRVMGVAFEATRCALDGGGVAPERIATIIISLAQAGERNPDRLCERALELLPRRPPALTR